MPIAVRPVHYARFQNGNRPPEDHFRDWLDSFAHLTEDVMNSEEMEAGTATSSRLVTAALLAAVFARRSQLVEEIDNLLGSEVWRTGGGGSGGDGNFLDLADVDGPSFEQGDVPVLNAVGVFVPLRTFTSDTQGLGAWFTYPDSITAVEDFVQFQDQSTGNPTSWEWDFGDGNTSTSQNPTHGYVEAGDYYVTLTITDAQGGESFQSRKVTVNQ